MPFIALVYVPDHTADAIRAGEINVGRWGTTSRFVGLFRWPTNREIGCTAPGHLGWVRDPGGFMKCSVCGRRNRRVRRMLINALFDILGANSIETAPAAFRTPEGYANN